MEKAKILSQLIDEKGMSRRAFAEEIGIPATTLQSMLTRGVGKAAIDNVLKVCKGLGITTDELEQMAKEGTIHISKDKGLSADEILTLAAHQVGHQGALTEEQLAQVKLAMKIALAKNDK